MARPSNQRNHIFPHSAPLRTISILSSLLEFWFQPNYIHSNWCGRRTDVAVCSTHAPKPKPEFGGGSHISLTVNPTFDFVIRGYIVLSKTQMRMMVLMEDSSRSQVFLEFYSLQNRDREKEMQRYVHFKSRVKSKGRICE